MSPSSEEPRPAYHDAGRGPGGTGVPDIDDIDTVLPAAKPPFGRLFHPSEWVLAGVFVLAVLAVFAVSCAVIARWIGAGEWSEPHGWDSKTARAWAVAGLALTALLGVWARFVEPRLLLTKRLDAPGTNCSQRQDG